MLCVAASVRDTASEGGSGDIYHRQPQGKRLHLFSVAIDTIARCVCCAPQPTHLNHNIQSLRTHTALLVLTSFRACTTSCSTVTTLLKMLRVGRLSYNSSSLMLTGSPFFQGEGAVSFTQTRRHQKWNCPPGENLVMPRSRSNILVKPPTLPTDRI